MEVGEKLIVTSELYKEKGDIEIDGWKKNRNMISTKKCGGVLKK